jgi:hypothetical protein
MESAAQPQIKLPPVGTAFTAWKVVQDAAGQRLACQIEIPAEARRLMGPHRECRAQFVKVLRIYGADEAVSMWTGTTLGPAGKLVPVGGKPAVYMPGQPVFAHDWKDTWGEETGGIRFFYTWEDLQKVFPNVTREEAG